MYNYKYPHPSLTADCIVLAFDGQNLNVLLVERKNNPFAGCWAFPGGFMEINETVENAAKRELIEETGLQCNSLIQFHTFSKVDRDERERVVSTAFIALYPKVPYTQAADDAKQTKWFDIKELPEMAFDHKEMLIEAFLFLQTKVHSEPVLFELLPPIFSIDAFQNLYEAIMNVKFDHNEFLHFISRFGFVESVPSVNGMYRFNKIMYSAYLKGVF